MEEKVVSSCSMATNMITLVAKRIDELIKNLKKKKGGEKKRGLKFDRIDTERTSTSVFLFRNNWIQQT